MPGNVSLATVADVAPVEFCGAFTEQRAWPVIVSGPYPDGRSQRRYDAATSRKVWSLSKRLTETQWDTVLEFWDDMRGPLTPFYYYENRDDHDPTGEAMTGRAIARFQGNLTRTRALARASVEVNLIQVE
jgi:hypothetical protein